MSTGSVARSLARSLRSDASTSTTLNRLSRAPAPSPRPATRSPLAYAQTAATTTMTCTCAHLQARYYSSYPTQHPAANANPPRRKRTIMDLQSNKRKKIPITMLTAHDYPSARFIEAAASSHHHHHHPPGSSTSGDTGSPAPGTAAAAAAKPPPRGVDIALIGDSLAMVACGYPSTTHLTLDEMLYHCRSVARGCKTSLLVADLPYGTFAVSVEQGVHAAVRITQEGHMDAVKIEGGEEVAPLIKRLTDVGIPVMGHVGLTPQRQAALSGYRVQGKTVSSAMKVYHDALAIQHAGAFAVVLEAVPARLAEWISSRLEIPTIGIGAGKGCDGQVLVQLDMLGVDSDLGVGGKGPRFLKKYASLGEVATGAVRTYVDEVRNGAFPGEEHTYPISDEAFRGFLEAVAVEEQDPSERL